MKTVYVLLSSFNGEKYIQEQIDSILSQSYNNIEIYIRDDGSTDKTVQVIRQYQKIYSSQKIHLDIGENIGFGRSFLRLLKNAPSNGYYAFCDQDDVWSNHKIERAVKHLQGHDDIPSLYHSDYYDVDEKLIIKAQHKLPKWNYDFPKSITEVIHMGFSEIMNDSLRKIILNCDIESANSHDHLTELCAMAFANIIEDPIITSKHRRLDNSISGMSLTNRLNWLKKALHGENEISSNAHVFFDVYKDELPREYFTILSWFVFEKFSLYKSIKKAFFPHRWRTSILSEMILRTLMLLGKI